MRPLAPALLATLVGLLLASCSDSETGLDGGASGDAGLAVDGGATRDVGAPADAGLAVDGGATQDGGASADAGLVIDAGTTQDSGAPADASIGSDSGPSADAGGRTRIYPGFCPSTDTAPGLYEGSLASNLNDIASASCLGPTPGRDGALRVTVPANATITATYQSSGDAVLYLLDSCPVSSSCLVGADDSVSGPETITWTNNSGSDNPVYVVLDHAELSLEAAFTLDLSVQ